MAWTCSTYEGEERCIQDFVGEKLGKRPLARHRSRWEENIEIGLQEVGCCGMGWIDLVLDRDRWWLLLNAVMNNRIP